MSDDVLDAITKGLVDDGWLHQDDVLTEYELAAIATAALDALSAAGLVVLYDPSGTLHHGDELMAERKLCSLLNCPHWFDRRAAHAAACKPIFLYALRRRPEGSEQ